MAFSPLNFTLKKINEQLLIKLQSVLQVVCQSLSAEKFTVSAEKFSVLVSFFQIFYFISSSQ
jgi:hypothetical protein